jgi:hypothetical protein
MSLAGLMSLASLMSLAGLTGIGVNFLIISLGELCPHSGPARITNPRLTAGGYHAPTILPIS